MKTWGILILSNIRNVKAAIAIVKKYVNNLYIHLNIPAGVKVQVPQWSSIISKIYLDSSHYDSTVDVRILVNSIKKQKSSNLGNVQHIFCDGDFPDICNSLKKFYHISKPEVIFANETRSFFDIEQNVSVTENLTRHDVVVLGGTFDRIHIGHKIFLTEAVLRACKKLVVGITDENMLKDKTLSELILPTNKRIKDVKNFLSEIDSNLEYEVVPIKDPFGPTKCDPNMDMIIVSEETYRGGLKVNEIRKQNNLKELDIYTIKLIGNDVDLSHQHKEAKISSSNTRMDLLGTLLKKPEKRNNIPDVPYIIGLTGNIGSGKSRVCQHFSKLGAYVIDCDKVAHDIYEPNEPAYEQILAYFGQNILDSNGKIDRKKLGSIVFDNPKELKALENIVWPAILNEAKRRIKDLKDIKVVILEAAILFKAGWEIECHEVWSMIIPEKIMIKRVQDRNNLSEEDARKRIQNQCKNKDIVEKSNVVFSSQWSYEFTNSQVEKAWLELQKRLQS